MKLRDVVLVFSLFFMMLIVIAQINEHAVGDYNIEAGIQCIGYLLFLAGIYVYYRKSGQVMSAMIANTNRRDKRRKAGHIVIASIVWSNLCSNITAIVAALISHEEQMTPVPIKFDSYLIGFITVVILAPIVEEIVFRGILYKYLRGRYSCIVSLLIVSIVWSILHVSVIIGINTFLISIAITLVYEGTKDIRWPILAHSINNSIALLSTVPVVAEGYSGLMNNIVHAGFYATFLLTELLIALLMFRKIMHDSQQGEREHEGDQLC